MDIGKIEKLTEQEPGYRLKQIKRFLFVDLIDDWDKASNLPKNLREKLKAVSLSDVFVKKILKDKDAVKALFQLSDGFLIESVLMKHKDKRNTVCVSTQVGCAMGCTFCATGAQGFERNLSFSEIVDQVLFFARFLKPEKVTNVVFMGMGEPLLNYDNMIRSVEILNDKEGFNLGSRKFSVSTVGIVEGIEKLANEKYQINLAVSLHAPNNKLRSRIIKQNKVYPIEKIMDAVRDYSLKTNKKVMFEYLMIKDFNDSLDCAKELSKLLNNSRLYFVNLISYNPTRHCRFAPSTPLRIKKFKEFLENRGIVCVQRFRFGENFDAACGQLTTKRSFKNENRKNI